MQSEVTQDSRSHIQVEQTTCCIAGSGPAGAMLALLLARKGIPVVLLEEHMDFDRDFRGDTLHPSVLQIIDELGLSERLLQLEHTKAYNLSVQTTEGPVVLADFRRLKTHFPYIALLPQAHFLEFITAEASRYPNFQLVMGARVEKLLEEDGSICGVQYRGSDGWHEMRAVLTVGADGRFSRVRRLAGFEAMQTAQTIDVLWFRLPRKEGDSSQTQGRLADGHILVILNRNDYWQIGYVIPKGGYQKLHSAGMEALQRELGAIIPEWADRLETLKEWKQVSVLSVESSRLPRWYKPGLLLIGDAAHVMSPVGGVGINYAIQDAVIAANTLGDDLLLGEAPLEKLAKVQRQRELPTRIIQGFQNILQKQLLGRVVRSEEPVRFSPLLRFALSLPVLRNIPARMIAFGPQSVHVKQ